MKSTMSDTINIGEIGLERIPK
ncbi:Protein of unknown function [Bacillus cereus]|nr:Protein of unknown function [Bacillus cereus]